MFAPTAVDVTLKVALVAPAATVTLAGTAATATLELLKLTRAPPLGAPPVNVTVPWTELPPTTDVGLTLTAERLAAAGAAWGMKRREADQLPATPAEFLARTRHQCRTADKPETLVCDAVEVKLRTNGVVKLLLSST